MKYLSIIIVTALLTGCASSPRLTKADLKYFPVETINISSQEECEVAKRRLDKKFPKEYNRNDGKSYWLDAKTQKAYRLTDTFDSSIECLYIGRNAHKLVITSFYELAERNAMSQSSKREKKDFLEKRVDRLGI